MSTLRLGILASGRGSNLQSIMDAAAAGKIGAEVVVVISDNKDAFALERARRAGIPARYVGFGYYASKDDYERAILDILRQNKVDLVCLAGYMRLVGRVILDAYSNRIMNIHPALLPSFPGLHAQKQAWEYGVKYSGCTVHFVDEGMDTGPIIIQAVVPVYDDDTPDTLATRILEQEHKIYPEAIRLYAEGRLKIQGRKVFITK
ncbi:MAG TPA: phosphoribosylglycinamide formyltransferase [Bacillota bacterium]|nr:phosphoribosylglycinamide formyltransferase [Peptococcaceae bacterium MAG4]NLW39008.1 phosphoribosylglycinamide formyltransferase [Peptococcaceae bacterium]HPZ43914.1 phosphoribosylglycinamide formyltransferase [Bacillota bacterium]HQD76269.1 phosphoribosylglycinamide formyltransferase [Bacillota bacterium]HUM59091.1 phosphoribosylglycinamide formyltransferase [Bacillota bacterium]